MAKKTAKTTSKKQKISPSWDQLGKWIGEKIQKELHTVQPKQLSWQWHGVCMSKKGHFCSALFFGTLLAWIMNQQGILLSGIPLWIQVLLVVSFAFMMS